MTYLMLSILNFSRRLVIVKGVAQVRQSLFASLRNLLVLLDMFFGISKINFSNLESRSKGWHTVSWYDVPQIVLPLT